jgi:PDZ domain-containing protein/aspartyl protease
MRTASSFLLALVFGAFLPPLAAEEPARTDAKPIVVPFELLKSRHMAVEVKINGNGPYRLIFDTGAPTNLINNKLAKDAGVMKKGDKGTPLPIFGMGGIKMMDSVEIGAVKLEKVPVTVMDHPTVTAISKALGPIDGIIGFPFFAKFKTTVDYQKKEITFTPNDYVPGDVMQGMMNKLMAPRGKPEPRILAPAAMWGFTVDDKDAKDEAAGVTVKDVLAESPAASGGLKSGDRLLTLDGRWTDSLGDTFTAASAIKPGRPVVLTVTRDGKEVKLTVKPAKGT